MKEKIRIKRLRAIYEGVIEDSPEAYTKQLFENSPDSVATLGCISS